MNNLCDKLSKNLKWQTVAVVGVFAFVAFAFCWNMYLEAPSQLAEEKTIIVPNGASLKQIAHLVDNAGVAVGYKRFRLAVATMRQSKNLQAGEYIFPAHISLKGVVNKLSTGDVTRHLITIPEGLTVLEITNKLNLIKKLQGKIETKIIEGTLFPDTYAYQTGDTKESVINRMKKRMEKELQTTWESKAEGLPFRSPKEMLILASIVEKETGMAGERAKIAGVFINRLNKVMKLQSDPTVIYGAIDYKGDLTTMHLRDAHPYNTYAHYGLTPTPIANPGKAALQAVARPEKHEFLYFVANGEGGHNFAKTHTQHLKNVEKYLKFYRQKYGRK